MDRYTRRTWFSTGPYHVVRHPLYVNVMIFFRGSVLI
jgi:protein-S-isoprenylcysteine O-methyltransferase Ste14